MSDRIYQFGDVVTQFNEFDKALLFKMGVNDEDDLNNLLVYYRDRVNEIDKERVEWLEKLEEIKIKIDEKHKAQWENQKRVDEIAELQKTITELKIAVFDERQLVLKFQRENDALKIKEVDDRKKIQELLSLTEPVEETIVLQKDIRPNVTQKFVQNDLNIHKNKENFNKVIQKLGGSYTTTGGKGRSVVKTIYLPNETLNTISQENECLKKYIERERENFTQQINALKEELAIKDEEHKLHYNQQQAKIKELTEKLQENEKQHLGLTKEFFTLRQKCNDSEKKLHEENEVIRLRNTALANKLIIAQKQTQVENKVSKELLENKCEEYTNKFRNQIKKKDDSLQIMKNQYAQAQKIYLGKVRELEASLTKLAEKYYQLERKRKYECEGFKNQVKDLTKKLEQQEFRLYQNEQMIEEEDEPSLTKSEKELIQIKQAEKENKKKKQLLVKKTAQIYGASMDRKAGAKKTLKKKPVHAPHSGQKYERFSSAEKENYQEDEDNYQDEENDQINQSDSVGLEELEGIKQQLNDLERQLDIARNQ